jgi:hypothetical protein
VRSRRRARTRDPAPHHPAARRRPRPRRQHRRLAYRELEAPASSRPGGARGHSSSARRPQPAPAAWRPRLHLAEMEALGFGPAEIRPCSAASSKVRTDPSRVRRRARRTQESS